MNDLENKRWPEGWQRTGEPEKTFMSKAWKVIVVVLAVIGGLALIAVIGMFWMHNSMMDGVGIGWVLSQ